MKSRSEEHCAIKRSETPLPADLDKSKKTFTSKLSLLIEHDAENAVPLAPQGDQTNTASPSAPPKAKE